LDGAVGIYFEWRRFSDRRAQMHNRSISGEQESAVLDRGLIPYRDLHNTMEKRCFVLKKLRKSKHKTD